MAPTTSYPGPHEKLDGFFASLFPAHPFRWVTRTFAVYIGVGAVSAAVAYGVAVIPNSPLLSLVHRSEPIDDDINRQKLNKIFDKLNSPKTSPVSQPATAPGLLIVETISLDSFVAVEDKHPLFESYGEGSTSLSTWKSQTYPYFSGGSSTSSKKYVLPLPIGTPVYKRDGTLIGGFLSTESDSSDVTNWTILDIVKPDRTVVRVFTAGSSLSIGLKSNAPGQTIGSEKPGVVGLVPTIAGQNWRTPRYYRGKSAWI